MRPQGLWRPHANLGCQTGRKLNNNVDVETYYKSGIIDHFLHISVVSRQKIAKTLFSQFKLALYLLLQCGAA
jgi:hypothetical protein